MTVAFAGQAVGATADPDGRWIVVLAPMAADPSGTDLTVTGRSTVAARDVVVGEVWICSGGSGMESPVDAPAHYPLIRQFKVQPAPSPLPLEAARGEWRVCSPGAEDGLTAVGFFFARDLFSRLNVPLGIISAAAGGTTVESWMSPAALAAHADAEPGGGPWPPGSAFNGMIHPLLQYAIRGAIWYQGEADAGQASGYGQHFRELITAWRTHFGQGDFPFFWVQLASAAPAGTGPGEPWAQLREAQSGALSLAATGQAVAIDLGEVGSAHPGTRQEVGRRLALLAKAKVYGIPVDYSGPAYRDFVIEGSSIRVRFSFAGDGLTASGKPLQSFEVAGADREFHPAGAVIQGDSVVVHSAAVALPVAVRYAWRDAPEANLHNGAGLPAPPFRSDNW